MKIDKLHIIEINIYLCMMVSSGNI